MITLKSGTVIPEGVGPYATVEIVRVFRNNWCQCKWPDGRTFLARAYWLVQTGQYRLVRTEEND